MGINVWPASHALVILWNVQPNNEFSTKVASVKQSLTPVPHAVYGYANLRQVSTCLLIHSPVSQFVIVTFRTVNLDNVSSMHANDSSPLLLVADPHPEFACVGS